MKNTKFIALILILLVSGYSYAQRSSNVTMPIGEQFIIQSAMNYGANNGGCWDIPGHPGTIGNGSNIQVWTLDGGHDRKYTILNSPENGFYEIRVGNTYNARVDIAGGRSNNGTNVHAYERNNSIAQRFAFVHLGNGRFKIYDRNGKILCLKSRSNNNGTNVHIWDDHNGASVEWYLVDPATNRAFNPDAKPTPKPAPKPTPKPAPAPAKKTVMPTKR